MKQLVYDSRYVGKTLMDLDWPSRFQTWTGDATSGWKIIKGTDHYTYEFAGGENDSLNWLRYRHVLPRDDDWDGYLKKSELPPRIRDLVAGNGLGAGSHH